MDMTGIKVATATAFLTGSGASLSALVDPKELSGLGDTALLALVTIAALSVLTYFIRTLSEDMRHLIVEMSVSNTQTRELCSRLDNRPCLILEESKEITRLKHANEDLLRIARDAGKGPDKP
jgi:hypothetical protein